MGLELIGETQRKNMGDVVPVALFRALRMCGVYEGMREIAGRGASAIIYRGGLSVGKLLGAQIIGELKSDIAMNSFLGSVVELCKNMKIGYLSIIDGNPETPGCSSIVVRVDECVTCAGLPNIKDLVCQFEGGMISGILESYVGKKLRSTEIECCANGNEACVFRVDIS